jgi:hypothetical protein
VSDLNLLAKDLKSGDLTAAQQDYATLSDDALNAASSTASTSSGSSSPVVTAGEIQAEIVKLVDSIVQALEAGDSTFVSGAMTQLAAISPSAQRASLLKTESAKLSASGSSSSGSVGQLLQSLESGSPAGAVSILSEVA